jgi:hypothetical protein
MLMPPSFHFQRLHDRAAALRSASSQVSYRPTSLPLPVCSSSLRESLSRNSCSPPLFLLLALCSSSLRASLSRNSCSPSLSLPLALGSSYPSPSLLLALCSSSLWESLSRNSCSPSLSVPLALCSSSLRDSFSRNFHLCEVSSTSKKLPALLVGHLPQLSARLCKLISRLHAHCSPFLPLYRVSPTRPWR